MKQLESVYDPKWRENWEDAPDRVAYQEQLHNRPKRYDERSARHNGIIGLGAVLKSCCKKLKGEQSNESTRCTETKGRG